MADLTILTATDVNQVIQTLDLNAALHSQASVFQAYSAKRPAINGVEPIQTPQRLAIQSTKTTTLYMPARVEGDQAACKIVAIPKAGGADGLPATTLVVDDEGRVKGVVNARQLTALRNACGSALFLQLAPPPKPPTNLVIFGSGAQAQSHATVLVRLFPTIRRVTFAVRSINDRATKLLEKLEKFDSETEYSLKVTSAESHNDLQQVVRAANIIVTVTSSTEALFPSEWVTAGTRLILVGAYTPKMREVDAALVKRAGIIVVDSIEACGHEAGDLLQANVKDEDLIELGTIVADESARSTVGRGGDVAIFKSVGLGIQDVAITRIVFDAAVSRGLGRRIEDYDVPL